MKLKITRQRNEANEISIDMDMMINGQKYHLTGYVNFQEYDGEIEIISNDAIDFSANKSKDLYDFCEELGYDYYDVKDYIINHTDNKITN